MRIDIESGEITVTNGEESFTIIQQSANFRLMSDPELAELINERANAIGVSISVTESDIPKTDADKLREQINNASNLQELKDALTGETGEVQAKGHQK